MYGMLFVQVCETTGKNVETKHTMAAKQTDKCISEQVVNVLVQETHTQPGGRINEQYR